MIDLSLRESRDLEALYHDICEQKGLNEPDKALIKNILKILDKRGYRING